MALGDLLWTPAPDAAERSQMAAFMRHAAAAHGFVADAPAASPANWDAFWRWSVERPAAFWAAMLEFAEVAPAAPAASVMRGEGMLGTTWFDGMRLNYARHMLRVDDDRPAIIHEDEIGRGGLVSFRELRICVARCAAALRSAGVVRGDRVAGFMPNLPETIIAMLAAASIGAIWSSCSPDFGVRGVLDRFGQIAPKVLFGVDGYSYSGKTNDTISRLREIAGEIASLTRVVIVPFSPDGLARSSELPAPFMTWDAFCGVSIRRSDKASRGGPGITASGPTPPLQFEEAPFDHPLFIMYSSGTTGAPKCIVHGHGGTLLQHMKELMLHCDLRAGERLFYFTTCGWMMWNWLASGLGCGAAIVLYEGNPCYPDMGRLWRLAAEQRVDVFGTSAKYLAACEKAGVEPGRDCDLSALRCICSTGSPLSAELFEWTYAHVKRDIQLSSICGGTDIISCFILGNPLLPVHSGEIQCCGLGMNVAAWDERGRAIVGEKGELVCLTPFPSQPVGFWNDPDGAKYRAAYFSHYGADAAGNDAACAGAVWRHGDFVEFTPRGGVIVYGRSDATLNPGGVRIGTAEIYRIVEGIPEITDSLVVGRDTPDQDVEVCLFVVLRPGAVLDDTLKGRIRESIAAHATKRHVPRHIRQVRAVPYTISGKKVELAVRQVLHGQDVPNRDALANPEALEDFRGIV